MSWFQKAVNLMRRKDAGTSLGGFELLRRVFGSDWSKGGMLAQYEKSLYVFRCVGKIAEKVASTDLQLFQIINSKGETKELANHPVLDLFYKPNPFQTKTEFFSITMTNLKLCGDAFWFKVRNNGGRVVELWNLRPDYMEIVKDPTEYIKGYRFTKADGTTSVLMPDEIVHFKYPNPLDEHYGISPIKSAQTRIDTETLASTYQRDFFLNNARPDAVLKSPNIITDAMKQEAKGHWGSQHRGPGNNSKIAILDGGLEYQQISVTQREMDYIESMKFTRDDILVAFGVPKPVLGITEDVNRANGETGMYIFLSETVKPDLTKLYEKANEMLVIPDFGENLFVDYKDPTPENREQTLREYENGIKNGWLLINEVRQAENRPAVDGGDSLYLPLNMQPVGTLTPEQKTLMRTAFASKMNSDEIRRRAKVFHGRQLLRAKFLIAEKAVETIRAMKQRTNAEKIEDASAAGKRTKGTPTSLIKGEEMREKYADYVIKKIDKRAERMKSATDALAMSQLKRLLKGLSKKDLTKEIGSSTGKFLDKFFKADAKVWAEFAFPFIEEYARQAGIDAMDIVNPGQEFLMSQQIVRALKERSQEFGLGVNGTTRDKVAAAINEGLVAGEGIAEISDRVSESYKEFPTWRSDLIARTEATAATNEGFMESFRQSKVATHKEWVATKDSRTRAEHVALNGEIVPTSKEFSNGLQYPQEPNCRCVLAPAFEQ